jgi:hypothetical protein
MKQAFLLHLDQSFGKTLKNKSFGYRSTTEGFPPNPLCNENEEGKMKSVGLSQPDISDNVPAFPFDGKWRQSIWISSISRENCALSGLRGKEGHRHASIRRC